jgi:gamma-glutamyltranspeptidase/glutathione hydrolase
MYRYLAFLCCTAILSAQGGGRGNQPVNPYPEQGRSVVVSRSGIVATSQTLASEAGAMILARGGSAVDAAIAANAVLSVTEPVTNGVGGDLFAIVYEAKTKKLYGLNASGWAPAGLSLDVLRKKGIAGTPPEHSIHFVTVPGAVAGWEALYAKFGKVPFADLMAPAIYHAENGVPIAERMAALWAPNGRARANIPGFSEVFLPSGNPVKAGEIFVDRDLGKTLRAIAQHGRDGFYKGPVAKSILELSAREGGTMSAEDLEKFQPEWVDPISTSYHGWTVWELPPNGQGVAALSMLNMMERFPLKDYGQNSARALHVMIEAKKLAYADIPLLGDPRFLNMPVRELISKELAEKRAALIDAEKAHCDVLPSDLTTKLNAIGKDTTYLSVIDQDGNIVSLIQSIYDEFGTGLVPPGTGFILHDRGALFDFTPGKPNSLAPRKRPETTIIPAFMEKGDVKIGFGIMGGFNQAQAHAQFVSDVVDFGFNIQAALEAPRFTKISFDGCDVQMESRMPESVRAELAAKGHRVRITGPYVYVMGRGNAVMSNGKGVNLGGSDPRGDGEAIPQALPQKIFEAR